MQQTPNPDAQEPPLCPPRPEHSASVKQVPFRLLAPAQGPLGNLR